MVVGLFIVLPPASNFNPDIVYVQPSKIQKALLGKYNVVHPINIMEGIICITPIGACYQFFSSRFTLSSHNMLSIKHDWSHLWHLPNLNTILHSSGSDYALFRILEVNSATANTEEVLSEDVAWKDTSHGQAGIAFFVISVMILVMIIIILIVMLSVENNR